MKLFQFINYCISLVVICNPLSAFPALLNLTQGKKVEEKKRIAFEATIAVLVILVATTWIGDTLLQVAGIRLSAFQLAGGLVILMLALSMLQDEQSKIKASEAPLEQKRSIAIVPLAIPIIAGPGAISTVIVHTSIYAGVHMQFLLTLGAIIVTAIMGLVLYFAVNIERVLGVAGVSLVNRIGGLILAAIAVDMMATGAVGLFPAWGKIT